MLQALINQYVARHPQIVDQERLLSITNYKGIIRSALEAYEIRVLAGKPSMECLSRVRAGPH
jgi:hypothetical protein